MFLNMKSYQVSKKPKKIEFDLKDDELDSTEE
jgi:hypothetical protein